MTYQVYGNRGNGEWWQWQYAARVVRYHPVFVADPRLVVRGQRSGRPAETGEMVLARQAADDLHAVLREVR